MALTIAIEGLGVLSDASSITNWGITGSGGASFDLDTEMYYQGTSCNSTALSANKHAWLWYNYGSAINFLTTYVGQKVYIWFNCTTVGSMNTLTTPGLAVRMGSSTTVYRTWTIAGVNNLNGYTGGWRCMVIDPTLAGSMADSGAYSASTIQYIGIYYDGLLSARSNNLFVDTIAVGKGIRVYGTSNTLMEDIVAYCTDLPNRAWGMVQQKEGIYYIYGKIFIGGDALNDTVVSSSGKILKWGDCEYYDGSAWVTSIGNGFNGLTIDDHASHKTEFTDGALVGSDTGRSGNAYIGSTKIDTTFDLYGGLNTSSLTYLYGSIIQGIGGGITWGNNPNHRMYSCTVTACGVFDPVGAPVIRNCLFLNAAKVSGALLWNSNINISNCSFIANITGPAIRHIVGGSSGAHLHINYDALMFSGNVYDIENAATTPNYYIDIDRINGSNPDETKINNSAGGTTTILPIGVSLTLTGLISGSDIVILTAGTTTEVANVQENPGTTYIHSYNYMLSDYVDIGVFKAGYVPFYIRNYLLSETNGTLPIKQIIDRAYIA